MGSGYIQMHKWISTRYILISFLHVNFLWSKSIDSIRWYYLYLLISWKLLAGSQAYIRFGSWAWHDPQPSSMSHLEKEPCSSCYCPWWAFHNNCAVQWKCEWSLRYDETQSGRFGQVLTALFASKSFLALLYSMRPSIKFTFFSVDSFQFKISGLILLMMMIQMIILKKNVMVGVYETEITPTNIDNCNN